MATVRDLAVGDLVNVSGPNAFEVMGRVKEVRQDEGYQTLVVDVDGLEYHVGTGGHLGDTWTMYDGSQRYYVEKLRG